MDRKLIDYLPHHMRDYKEMIAITSAEQPEFELLWNICDKTTDNAFISYEDEASAERWEGILNITPKSTDTLETRNFRILTKTQTELPYTYRGLVRILNALTSSSDQYSISVDVDNYKVTILVALTSQDLLNEVQEVAERIVPAEMILVVSLMYATHEMLTSMTYGELAAYTQSGVRNLEFD